MRRLNTSKRKRSDFNPFKRSKGGANVLNLNPTYYFVHIKIKAYRKQNKFTKINLSQNYILSPPV